MSTNTFLDRLTKEEKELGEKATGLSNFIGTEAFHKIDKTQRHLLEAQLGAMKSYRGILNQRLSLLKE